MWRAAIVVPCYNETRRLPADAFARFARRHPEVAFLFVDDASTDGTAAMLHALCRRAPSSLRVMTLGRHAGKAEAVRRGMLEALRLPCGQYAGYWDADLATPLEEIDNFIRIHDGDRQLVLVMGARVQLLGRRITRLAGRHYSGRIFATLASLLLALPVYDTQCGAKLFRASPRTRRLFLEPFATEWIFDVEILARMTRDERLATGLGIERLVHELPLTQWSDVGGSKRKPRDYLEALRDLLVIRHRYMRGLPPCRQADRPPPREPRFTRVLERRPAGAALTDGRSGRTT